MSIYSKVRAIIRGSVLNVLGTFCKPAPYVHILNGHMVDRKHDNNRDGVRFAKHLAELHRYCDFVNFEDALKMILSGKKVERCTVAFSFDDGYRDDYTQIAPQLEKYGVNAMFFVNPNFADAADSNDVAYIEDFTINTTRSPGKLPMTWTQMKDLQKRGFLFGAHTLDHYCINDDNIERLEHQIGDCRRVMEERLGVPCDYFAFPYGRLEHANLKSIEIACRHYKYVFSQSDYKHYFSYGGKVINRRHFEPYMSVKFDYFFLSHKRK